MFCSTVQLRLDAIVSKLVQKFSTGRFSKKKAGLEEAGKTRFSDLRERESQCASLARHLSSIGYK
jgi:hypothetical protein